MWTRRASKELTDCFGGSTPVPAPGTNVLEGRVLYEKGQVLVVSGCDDRREFLKHRARLQSFVKCMGEELDQAWVFVLAFPSDSFLLEVEEPGPG